MEQPKPVTPCPDCKGNDWWWRETNYGKGEWLCQKCHPPVGTLVSKGGTSGQK